MLPKSNLLPKSNQMFNNSRNAGQWEHLIMPSVAPLEPKTRYCMTSRGNVHILNSAGKFWNHQDWRQEAISDAFLPIRLRIYPDVFDARRTITDECRDMLIGVQVDSITIACREYLVLPVPILHLIPPNNSNNALLLGIVKPEDEVSINITTGKTQVIGLTIGFSGLCTGHYPQLN